MATTVENKKEFENLADDTEEYLEENGFESSVIKN